MLTQNKIERIAQPADIERSRATPLRPVVWMTSVLVWATVVGLFLHVPTWAGLFLCASTGLSFLLFLVAYIYLFVNDREMLRAERYRGRKLDRSAVAIMSQETTELSLGERNYPVLEPATSLIAPMGESESRALVENSERTINK